MSEGVYRLERDPWHHVSVGFGVGQAAESSRFDMNDWVLRPKMRWPYVFMVLSIANGYGKGGQM